MNRHRIALVLSPPADRAQQEDKGGGLTKLQRPRRWRRSKTKWVPLHQGSTDSCGVAAEEILDNNQQAERCTGSADATTVSQCPRRQPGAIQLLVTATTANVAGQGPTAAGVPAAAARKSAAGVPCGVYSQVAGGRATCRSATESADIEDSMALAFREGYEESEAAVGSEGAYTTAVGGPAAAAASPAPPAAGAGVFSLPGKSTASNREGATPADASGSRGPTAYAGKREGHRSSDCDRMQGACGEVEVETELSTEQKKACRSSRVSASSKTVVAVHNETATPTDRPLTSPRLLLREQEVKCSNQQGGTANVREQSEGQLEGGSFRVTRLRPQSAAKEDLATRAEGCTYGQESRRFMVEYAAETPLQHSQDWPSPREADKEQEWTPQRICTENPSFSLGQVPAGQHQSGSVDECSSEKAVLADERADQQQHTGSRIRTKQLAQLQQHAEGKDSEARHPVGGDACNTLMDALPYAEERRELLEENGEPEVGPDAVALLSFPAPPTDEMASCSLAVCRPECLATAPAASSALSPSNPGALPAFSKTSLPCRSASTAIPRASASDIASAVSTGPEPLSPEEAPATLCCPGPVCPGHTCAPLTSATALDAENAAASDAFAEEAVVIQEGTTTPEAAVVDVEEDSFQLSTSERSLPGSRGIGDNECVLFQGARRRQGAPKSTALCIAEDVRAGAEDSVRMVQKETHCKHTKEQSHAIQFDHGDGEQILFVDGGVATLTETSSRHVESDNEDKTADQSGTEVDGLEVGELKNKEEKETRQASTSIPDAAGTLTVVLQPCDCRRGSADRGQTESAQRERQLQEPAVAGRQQKGDPARRSSLPEVDNRAAAGEGQTENTGHAENTAPRLLENPSSSLVSAEGKHLPEGVVGFETLAGGTPHSRGGGADRFSSSGGCQTPYFVAATPQRLDRKSGTAASLTPARGTAEEAVNAISASCSDSEALEAALNTSCRRVGPLRSAAALPGARTPVRKEASAPVEASLASKGVLVADGLPSSESETNARLCSSIAALRSTMLAENSAVISAGCASTLGAPESAAPLVFHSAVFHAGDRPALLHLVHQNVVSQSTDEESISSLPGIEVSLAARANVSSEKISLLNLMNVHGSAAWAGCEEALASAAAAATTEYQSDRQNDPAAPSYDLQSLRDSYSTISASRATKSRQEPTCLISQPAALCAPPQTVPFFLDSGAVRKDLELQRCSTVSNASIGSESDSSKQSSKSNRNRNKVFSVTRNDATGKILTTSTITKRSTSDKLSKAAAAGLDRESIVSITPKKGRARERIRGIEKRATLERGKKPASRSSGRAQKKATLLLRKMKPRCENVPKRGLKREHGKTDSENGHTGWSEEDWTSDSTNPCSSNGTTKGTGRDRNSYRSEGRDRDDGNSSDPGKILTYQGDLSTKWMRGALILEAADSCANGPPSAETQEAERPPATIVIQRERTAGAPELAGREERSKVGVKLEQLLLNRQCERGMEKPAASVERKGQEHALCSHQGQLKDGAKVFKQLRSKTVLTPIEEGAACFTTEESLRDKQKLDGDCRAGRDRLPESRNCQRDGTAGELGEKKLQQQRKLEKVRVFRETPLFTGDSDGKWKSLRLAEKNRSAKEKKAEKVAQLLQFHIQSIADEYVQKGGERKDKKARKQGKGAHKSASDGDVVCLTSLGDGYKTNRQSSAETDARQDWGALRSGTADEVVDGRVVERPFVAGDDGAELTVSQLAKDRGVAGRGCGKPSPADTTKYRCAERKKGARLSEFLHEYHGVLGKTEVSEGEKNVVDAADTWSFSIGDKLAVEPLALSARRSCEELSAQIPCVETKNSPADVLAKESRELFHESTRHLLPGDSVAAPNKLFRTPRTVGFYEGSVKGPAKPSATVPGAVPPWGELTEEKAAHSSRLGRFTPTRNSHCGRDIRSNRTADKSVQDRGKAGGTSRYSDGMNLLPALPGSVGKPTAWISNTDDADVKAVKMTEEALWPIDEDDKELSYESAVKGSASEYVLAYQDSNPATPVQQKSGQQHQRTQQTEQEHTESSILYDRRLRIIASDGTVYSVGVKASNLEQLPAAAASGGAEAVESDSVVAWRIGGAVTAALAAAPPGLLQSRMTAFSTPHKRLQKTKIRKAVGPVVTSRGVPAIRDLHEDEEAAAHGGCPEVIALLRERHRRCAGNNPQELRKEKYAAEQAATPLPIDDLAKKNDTQSSGNAKQASAEDDVQKPDGAEDLSPRQWHPRATGRHIDEKVEGEETEDESAATEASLDAELVLTGETQRRVLARGEIAAGTAQQGRELAGNATHGGDASMACTQPFRLVSTRFMRRLLKVVALKRMRRKTAATANITEEERKSCDVDEDLEWNDSAAEGSNGKPSVATELQELGQGHQTVVSRLAQTVHLHGRTPSLAEGKDFSRPLRGVNPSALITARHTAGDEDDTHTDEARSRVSLSSGSCPFSVALPSPHPVPLSVPYFSSYPAVAACSTTAPRPAPPPASKNASSSPTFAAGDTPSQRAFTSAFAAASCISGTAVSRPAASPSDFYSTPHPVAHTVGGVSPVTSRSADSTPNDTPTQEAKCVKREGNQNRSNSNDTKPSKRRVEPIRDGSFTAPPGRRQTPTERRRSETPLSRSLSIDSQQPRQRRRSPSHRTGRVNGSLEIPHGPLHTAAVDVAAGGKDGSTVRQKDCNWERKVRAQAQADSMLSRKADDALTTQPQRGRHNNWDAGTKFPVQDAAQAAIPVASVAKASSEKVQHEVLRLTRSADANTGKHGHLNGSDLESPAGRRLGSPRRQRYSQGHQSFEFFKRAVVEIGTSGEGEVRRQRKATAGICVGTGTERLNAEEAGDEVPSMDLHRSASRETSVYATDEPAAARVLRRSEKNPTQHPQTKVTADHEENKAGDALCKRGSLRVFQELLKGSRLKIEWDDQSSVFDSGDSISREEGKESAAVKSRDRKRRGSRMGCLGTPERTRTLKDSPNDEEKSGTEAKNIPRRLRRSRVHYATRTEKGKRIAHQNKHSKGRSNHCSSEEASPENRRDIPGACDFEIDRKQEFSGLDNGRGYAPVRRIEVQSCFGGSHVAYLTVDKSATSIRLSSENGGGVNASSETEEATTSPEQSEDMKIISGRLGRRRRGKGRAEDAHSNDSVAGDIAHLRRLREKNTTRGANSLTSGEGELYEESRRVEQAELPRARKDVIDDQDEQAWQYGDEGACRGSERWDTGEARHTATGIREHSSQLYIRFLEEGLHAARKNSIAAQMQEIRKSSSRVDEETRSRDGRAKDEGVVRCQGTRFFLTETATARQHHQNLGGSGKKLSQDDDWKKASTYDFFFRNKQYDSQRSKKGSAKTATKQAEGRERRVNTMRGQMVLKKNSFCSRTTAEAHDMHRVQQVSPADYVPGGRGEAQQLKDFRCLKRAEHSEGSQRNSRSQYHGRRLEQHFNKLIKEESRPHVLRLRGITHSRQSSFIGRTDVQRGARGSSDADEDPLRASQLCRRRKEKRWSVTQARPAAETRWRRQQYAEESEAGGVNPLIPTEDSENGLRAFSTSSEGWQEKGSPVDASRRHRCKTRIERDGVKSRPTRQKYGNKRDVPASFSPAPARTSLGGNASDPEEADLRLEDALFVEDQRQQALLMPVSSDCFYAFRKEGDEEERRIRDEAGTKRDPIGEGQRDGFVAEAVTGKRRHRGGDLRESWTGVGQHPRAGNREASPPQRNAEERVKIRNAARAGDTTARGESVSPTFASESGEQTAPLLLHSRQKFEGCAGNSDPRGTATSSVGSHGEEGAASGRQQNESSEENRKGKPKNSLTICSATNSRINCGELERTCRKTREVLRSSTGGRWRRRVSQQDVVKEGDRGRGDPARQVEKSDREASAQGGSSNLRSTQKGENDGTAPEDASNGTVGALELFCSLEKLQTGRWAPAACNADVPHIHSNTSSSLGEPTPALSTIFPADTDQEAGPSASSHCLRNVRLHTRALSITDSQPTENRETVSRRPSFEKREADGKGRRNEEAESRAHTPAEERKQADDRPPRSHRRLSASSSLSNERVPKKESIYSGSSTASPLERLAGGEQPTHPSWFRSVESLRTFPLLSSYDFLGEKGTAEVLRGSLPAPNSASLSSSNWHDRLQWSARQVFAAAKGNTEQQKTWGDKELLLCKEIGHFTAAARTAAVALAVLYPRGGPLGARSGFRARSSVYPRRSTFISEQSDALCRPTASSGNPLRVKTASAFVEVTPESFPTIWQIYKPKFDEDSLFLFDSLVLTMVRGSRRLNISAHEAGKVYAHDFKGRKAACTAIYKMHLTPDISPQAAVKRLVPEAVDLFDSAKIQGKPLFTRMDLALPFAAYVEYRGQRILVEPLMPINPPPVDVLEELMTLLRKALPFYVQQCSERAGSALTALSQVDKVDKDVSDTFKFLAKVLRLVDSPFPFGLSDFCKTLALPAVQLWRSRVDQLCIVRNLQELLPPLVIKGCVNPTLRFREIFVRHISSTSLPCTSLQPCEALSGKREKPALHHRSRPLNALELLESATESLMHQAAADLLGGVEAMSVNFLDSADLSITLHEQGLNTRLLGLLYSRKPGFVFQGAMLREMLARASKRLFLRQLEKLHREANDNESWEQLTERVVVAVFNLVFDKTEDSRMFWTNQLLPEVADMFDVEIPINFSPSDVSVESLFKAMEFHLGVRFSEDVFELATRNGIRGCHLRLPLTAAHLSSFLPPRDALLFPHILFIRRALEDGCKSTDGAADRLPGRETAEWKNSKDAAERHGEDGVSVAADFCVSDGDRNSRGRLEDDASFSQYLRGFYPKIKVIIPDLTVLETAREQAKTFMHMGVFPLEACQSHSWAGLVAARLRPMAFGTANVVSSGLGGAIRATILGLGYPCHPHCMRKGEFLRSYSAELFSADVLLQGEEGHHQLAEFDPPSSVYLGRDGGVEQSYSSRGVCLAFQGCRVALLVLLTVYCMIAHDVVVVAKILLQLAYVLLQHGHHASAATIAKYIVKRFPNVVYLESEAQLAAFQCVVKSRSFGRISAGRERLLPIFRSLEGNSSLRATLMELLVAAAAFQHEQWSDVVYHGAKVYKCPPLDFSSKGCHWSKIAALRLVGKSLAALGRNSEGVDVLKEAVREGEGDVTLPAYVTCMSRYWLAATLLKTNRFQDAKRQITEALEGLEPVLGPHHPITLSSLFLLARIQQTYGCEQVVEPPIEPATKGLDGGDCAAAGEHTFWRALTAEDLGVIEEVYGDQRRALSRKKALEAYGTLFRRLVVTGKYALVIKEQRQLRQSKLQQQQLLLTVQETLKTKMCHLPTHVLRLLAYRLQLLCVCQSGSRSLQRLALMQSSLLPYSRRPSTRPRPPEANAKGTATATAGECRTSATILPRKEQESVHRRIAEEKKSCDGGTASSWPLTAHFSYHRTTPSYGSHRQRTADVLQAEVIPRPDNIPERQHSVAMMKLLLGRKSPQIVVELLRCCCAACKEEEDLLPADWFDRMISSLLEERGALAELHNFVVMAANFFSPTQKNIFLHFLHGAETREVEDVLTPNNESDHAVYSGSPSYEEARKYTFADSRL